MHPRDCPICSLPLIPGPRDDLPPRCPNCGPITTPGRTPTSGGRRRDAYDDDDEYEPRRGRYDGFDRRRDRHDDDYDRRRDRDDDDDDYPRRFVRREGVPWYAILLASFMLGVAGLALLGNGFIFCFGFHAEFFRNPQPDPVGVMILAMLAVTIFSSLVAIAAGYSIIVGRRYWLAIVGCAAVALASHVLGLGVLVGIGALIVLLQAEVKESFR
jgi:hypothetical protein